ncbi:maleylpyruvate isomerase family mycothiol-dependent enzyme [Actinomarinicola tropica]|uniref:Maleylpyruvate isomerase family mycothiol-dependent enzyme n=1 Tax=Actinomarinicola tropica TaxID=2789776 RepID=A0A5Q2RS64_9ACTN|nr:maleylpyruvate isomerase family mycothiol-dependent enzyme [Actinomarinicola tropica]QGG96045.1 maleylpyruvate isomerase family mycothiol-dependent enzyme [Actinomarinicola tropica]
MGNERIAVDVAYRTTRERVTSWARGLTPEQATTPVPALPGWTVKDTFAHLAGLAADVVGGNVPAGVPDDEFTAREVAERADRSLPDVLDEWDAAGPRFEEILAALGDAAPKNAAVDVWSHEVDVRSALGAPLPVDGGPAERILDVMVRHGVGRSWGDLGVPALRIVLPDEEWVAGQGEPAGTLRTDRFELGRVMLGRRSPQQMRALGWDGGDPDTWIPHLHVFGPASADVVDSPRAT